MQCCGNGVVHRDFLKPRQTINSDHYTAILTKLKAETSRSRPAKKTTFLLQHSQARPHTGIKTAEHIAHLVWTVLPHPLYSQDLAPSDFHLIRLKKDRPSEQHLPNNDAIIAAVKQQVISADAGFYERSMQTLEHCWWKSTANSSIDSTEKIVICGIIGVLSDSFHGNK